MLKISKISIFLIFINYQAISQTIVAYNISPLSASVNSSYNVDYNLGLNIQQNDKNVLFNSSLFAFFSKNNVKNSYKFNIPSNLFLECYPNPATNFTNIIITSQKDFKCVDILIYNSKAQKQKCFWNLSKTQNYSKIYVDLQNLPTDFYIIEIIFDQKFQKTLKIIKN